MLAQEGILKQDGRGFRILDLDHNEMADAFEVRKLIEPYAIAKIVRREQRWRTYCGVQRHGGRAQRARRRR